MALSPEQVKKLKDVREHMQHVADLVPAVEEILAGYEDEEYDEGGEMEETSHNPSDKPNPFGGKRGRRRLRQQGDMSAGEE